MSKYIIKNVTIADGTGRNPEITDIAISGEYISSIGHLGDVTETIVDGSYLIAVPGIIDMASTIDRDWTLFTNPSQEQLLRNGITTSIGGSHLISAVPISNARTIARIATYSSSGLINVNWQGTREFFETASHKDFGVNFTTLLGGITLWMNVEDNKTADERLTVLATLIYQELSGGARGLAFSLNQTNKVRFSNAEITSFASIAKENNVPVILHLADHGEDVLASVTTAISIARDSGANILIHNFYIQRKHEHLLPRVLDIIDRARKDGAKITIGLLPWDFVEVPLLEVLPSWLRETTEEKLLQQVEIESSRSELVKNLSGQIRNPKNVIISSLDRSSGLNGLSLVRASEILHLPLEEAVIEILHNTRFRARVRIPGLSPNMLRTAARSDLTLIAAQNGIGSFESVDSSPVPQTPFVLAEQTRGILTYKEIAKKLSGDISKFFNLEKRGTIEKGNYADIVLIDPTKTGKEIIHSVFVNGKGIILESAYQQTTAGRILR